MVEMPGPVLPYEPWKPEISVNTAMFSGSVKPSAKLKISARVPARGLPLRWNDTVIRRPALKLIGVDVIEPTFGEPTRSRQRPAAPAHSTPAVPLLMMSTPPVTVKPGTLVVVLARGAESKFWLKMVTADAGMAITAAAARAVRIRIEISL